MKNRIRSTKPKTQPRVVASFGRADLVSHPGRAAAHPYRIGLGRDDLPVVLVSLRGASDDDLTAAKEWVSMFMHEAVLCATPIPHMRATSNSRWKVSSFGRSA
jgi:hypothetical protein